MTHFSSLVLSLVLLASGCSIENGLNPIDEDVAGPNVEDNGSDATGDGTTDTAYLPEEDTQSDEPNDETDTGEECVPTGDELCDGIDNDCDGNTDEGDAINATTWYADADSDEYGNPNNSIIACAPPLGYVADNTDCDDTSERNHPNALEHCDFEDNDCDGLAEIEDPSAAWELSWFDGDGDGFGVHYDGGSVAGLHCSVYGDVPEDHVQNNSDCDDDNSEIYPGHGC